jgi:predicted outer membrane lipoprotein
MLILSGEGLPATTAAALSLAVKIEVWVALLLVGIPTALACATAIILALSVERRDRVEAIKALPALLNALGPRPDLRRLITRPGHQ